MVRSGAVPVFPQPRHNASFHFCPESASAATALLVMEKALLD